MMGTKFTMEKIQVLISLGILVLTIILGNGPGVLWKSLDLMETGQYETKLFEIIIQRALLIKCSIE